ncbi:DUF4097 family beta strand repeat-containing protein [Nocardioides sambongensis]|uniref:DUF4097 family beta strand repeat-containing protein n=1 Tax=Nocardioides sambongensis TaxID=2589074 RepID=UPI00112715BC|nr:DUF4097 family beta strand repeat-containing protein [Nocardioides sambongensis]
MNDSNVAEYGFDTPGPVRLYVELGEGLLEVTASERATSTVHIEGRRAREVVVEQTQDGISVIAPRNRTGIFSGDQRLTLRVEVPSGSGLTVRTGSADVVAAGAYGDVRVKNGSGDVRLDQVGGVAVLDTGSGAVQVASGEGELRIRSGSGDVAVGRAGAASSISTGSGDVRLGAALADVVVKTGSGGLAIEQAEADVAMTTGSGSLVIGAASRGRITAKGASGDLRIGVPDGTPVWTDISTVTGRVRSDLRSVGEPQPGQDHLELRAVTVSGDVTLAAV